MTNPANATTMDGSTLWDIGGYNFLYHYVVTVVYSHSAHCAKLLQPPILLVVS